MSYCPTPTKRLHTADPAFPHPDQDTDNVPPPTLAEAVSLARKVLNDEKANMWIRRQAAFDLLLAMENHEEEL